MAGQEGEHIPTQAQTQLVSGRVFGCRTGEQLPGFRKFTPEIKEADTCARQVLLSTLVSGSPKTFSVPDDGLGLRVPHQPAPDTGRQIGEMKREGAGATTVDEYISSFPPNVRKILRDIRRTIRKVRRSGSAKSACRAPIVGAIVAPVASTASVFSISRLRAGSSDVVSV